MMRTLTNESCRFNSEGIPLEYEEKENVSERKELSLFG